MVVMDDEMMTAFNIMKSTVDLLEVSKTHLLKSGLPESSAPLLVVESVISELRDSIASSNGLCRLCGQSYHGGKGEFKDEGELARKLSSFAHTTIASQRDVLMRKKSRPNLVSQLSNISNFSNKSGYQSDPENTSVDDSAPSLASLARVPSKGSLLPSTGSSANVFKAAPYLGTKRYGRTASLKELESFNEKPVDVPELTNDADYIMKVKAQEAFMILDKDHSGTLDISELRSAFRLMGIPESELDKMLETILSEMDEDHSGEIDVEEFVTLLTSSDLHGNLANIQHAFNDITSDLINEHNRRNLDMVIGDSKCLLDPRGKISVHWDMAIAFLLIITIFTMPLSMAFEYFQKKLFPLDFAADLLFMMDIIKHFNTGYIDEFDFSIMNAKKVRSHYLKGWFVPDLLSSVPIEVINLILKQRASNFLRASKLLKLLRLSRLAKVFRLLKVTKLGKLLTEVKESVEDQFRVQIPEAALILSRLLVSLVVLAHWVGCINFMIVRLYDYPVDSWVVFANLENATINTQYSWCFYRALAQMIGVGFDVPSIVNTSCLERTDWCTVEHWITLTCLYIGSIFYALLISSVSYVVVNMNKGSSNLSMQLWTLNEYLKSKKIPHSIRDRVRNFYRIQFAEGKMYDEDEVLRLLPPNLRDDILSFNQRLLFEQVPLLSGPNTPEGLKSRLAPLLERRVMFAGEEIFEEGALGTELFFIMSGIVEVFSQYSTSIVKAISDGCYFGDVAVILGGRRTASTRARTNLVLSVIGRSQVIEIINEFPLVHKYMTYIAEKRRLRLVSLDPDCILPPLTSAQMKDEEDAQTKYFVKLSNVSSQDALFQHVQQYAPAGMSMDNIEMSQSKQERKEFDSNSSTDNDKPIMFGHYPLESIPSSPEAIEPLDFPSPTSSIDGEEAVRDADGRPARNKKRSVKLQPLASPRRYTGRTRSGSSEVALGDPSITDTRTSPTNNLFPSEANLRSEGGKGKLPYRNGNGDDKRPAHLDRDNLDNTSNYSDVDFTSTRKVLDSSTSRL